MAFRHLPTATKKLPQGSAILGWRMQGFLRLAALALLGAAASAPAKPVDLRNFHGVYRGKASIVLSGETYSGTARIVVQTGSKGRSAVMTVSGSFLAHGRTFPISNRISFSRFRTFAERSIAQGFPGNALGVTGRYTAHRHRLTFGAPFTVPGAKGRSIGSLATRSGHHGKQILTLRTSIIFAGRPADYIFDFRVSKYVLP